MNMERMLDIRFLVPPILTLFFIFFYSPSYFLAFLINKSALLSIVVGPVLILALGFIISSFVNAVVDLLDARTPTNIRELDIWRALEKEGQHVCNQVHKRWHIAIANFNSCFATVLAPILIYIFTMSKQIIPPIPTYGWGIIYATAIIGCAILFVRNGCVAWKNVMQIDEDVVSMHLISEAKPSDIR